MKKFAWCLSCFEQVDFTRQNVEHCKSIYDAPVYVITTSPKKGLFSNVGADKLVEWSDSPGNDCLDSLDKIEWRIKFLGQRVLGSIGKLLEICKLYEMDSCIHLHSDTFFTNKEVLLNELAVIKKYLFIGDLSESCESTVAARKEMPPNIHFCPEGLHININMANKLGFNRLEHIFDISDFKWRGKHLIEANIGTFAHYCITGGLNILNYDDRISSNYNRLIKYRTIRPYHGIFPHLTNLHGMQ